MASVHELNATYAIPGILAFDEPVEGFPRAVVTSPACTAELYLHGAHLAEWKPAHAADPALYLSPKTIFQQGKAIRGGVPVIFPWFGPRTPEVTGATTEGGQHGFARNTPWELSFAAVAGEDVHLVLTLGASEQTRALGFDQFRVSLEFRLGRELTIRMTVANEGEQPLVFEEALHTYLRVGDPEKVHIHGLGKTEFIDKVDGFQRKTQAEDVLTLHGETDRPYLNTAATVTVEDPELLRRIVVRKAGSQTTVVWNPWAELTAGLKDMPADGWKHFVCVESANASENRVSLAGRSAHILETHILVESL
ncbi:MAG: D-hexose-6-phosphate mutarotase [Acidobacteriaceae bacterium]|nr:D-hexose-6-phosphate mutarotase [Acidobacteriaceae bacterium]